jgi:small-conductance mechanosensitive channel
MSERLINQYEENESLSGKHEKDGSKAEQRLERSENIETKKDQQEKAAELAKIVQEQAKKSSEVSQNLDASQSTKGTQSYLVSEDLRNSSLKQTLNRVQKKLPFDQKLLSKIVHRPAINAVSDAAEKTVARPSGLVMGGAFSLVFSLFTLWLSYYFGYEYNYAIGLGSFIAGFAVGIILEALLRLLTYKKRRSL